MRISTAGVSDNGSDNQAIEESAAAESPVKDLSLEAEIGRLRETVGLDEQRVMEIEAKIIQSKDLKKMLADAKVELEVSRGLLAAAVRESILGKSPPKAAAKKRTRKAKQTVPPGATSTTTPAGIIAHDPTATGTTTERPNVDLSSFGDDVLDAEVDEFLPEGLAKLARKHGLNTFGELEAYRQQHNGHFVQLEGVGRGKSVTIVKHMEEFTNDAGQEPAA